MAPRQVTSESTIKFRMESAYGLSVHSADVCRTQCLSGLRNVESAGTPAVIPYVDTPVHSHGHPDVSNAAFALSRTRVWVRPSAASHPGSASYVHRSLTRTIRRDVSVWTYCHSTGTRSSLTRMLQVSRIS